MNLYKCTAIGFAALALGVSFSASSQTELSNEGIGDVVYSVLPPDLFAQTHEGAWRSLDGSEIASSVQLSQFLEANGSLDLLPNPDGGLANLPDARGVFLRGMNGVRDPQTGDPEGSKRTVGSFQEDALGTHAHGIKSNRIKRHRSGRDRDNQTLTSVAASGDRGNRSPNAAQRQNIGTAIANTGGAETRPRNIALYIYIKVGN